MRATRVSCLLAGIVAFAALVLPVFAHHGTAAFDTKKSVKMTGTVTDFRFLNPHVLVIFECKNDKGESEEWQGELTAPNKLVRAGWDKHTLKPGDSITVTGFVSTSGGHIMWIRQLIGPSGEPLPLFEE